MTSRQHRTSPRKTAAGVLQRLTALLALLGVLTVPPAVLLILVGNPAEPPAALRGPAALTHAVDDPTLLWLLAAAGWLLWLHLLLALAVELARQTRGSTMHLPLPGLLFGANAALASHLIAGLLLTGQAVPTAGLTPAAARVPLAVVQQLTASSSTGLLLPAGTAAGTGPASPDTQPATTITAARLPAAQPPSDNFAGDRGGGLECRVLPPHGRDHDTLWDIAERHLGDGTRWRDIYALNRGRLMPDGQRLTTASLIRPGWILRLPADAVALPVDAVLAPSPQRTRLHPAVPIQSTAAAADTDAAPDMSPQAPATAIDLSPHQAAPPADHSQKQSTAAAGDAARPAPRTAEPNGPQQDSAVAAAGLLGLAAVGLIAAVTRRRRIASRRRPAGVRNAPPAAAVRDLEAELRQQARAGQDAAATVQLALRLSVDADPQLAIRAVWQHPDGSYELVLTHAESSAPPPAPFTATASGWLLPADHVRFLYPLNADRTEPAVSPGTTAGSGEPAGRAADPCPLLLPVGSQGGSVCLVNLEPLGLVSLVEEPATPDMPSGAADEQPTTAPAQDPSFAPGSRAVLGGLLQALASAPWAELVHCYLPPTLADLTTGLDRLSPLDPAGDDFPYAVAELAPDEQQRVDSGGSLDQARRQHADLGEVRLSLWAGYTPQQLPDQLLRAAADPGNPNYGLLLGGHPGAATWTLTRAGLLQIPDIADRLTPLTLTAERQALIQRLLEHAEDPPQAQPDEPARAALLADCPPLATPAEQAGTGTAAPPPEPAGSPDLTPVLVPTTEPQPEVIDLTDLDKPRPQPPDEPHEQPDRADPPRPTASALSATARQGVPPSPATAAAPDDPTESGDLAVPESSPQLPQRLEVNVLGPLQIIGGYGNPPRRQCLELLVYLTLHRRPVPVQTLWEAVFPDRPYDSHQLVNRMSELRPYARQRLPQVKRSYQVDEFTVSDWQRFQALAAGNPAQQLEALALVRGRPFEDLTADWVHLEGQLAEIEASIVDLALTVGERALRGRDPDTARTAALAGLRGCPWEERLYRIAMQAATALGATGEVHQLRRQLQLVLDDELDGDDDLQPATRQLYSAVRDDEQRQRRALERRRNGV